MTQKETRAELDWQHKAKELEITAALMSDTGEAIWIINGAYLVACTVLLTILVNGAFGENPTGLELGGSTFGALGGIVVCWLWIASFERNYGFYNLRIHASRALEADLRFTTLTYGQVLSQKGIVKDTQGAIVGEISWIGRTPEGWGIQHYTRCLVIVFAAAFLAVLVVAAHRWDVNQLIQGSVPLSSHVLGPL